MLKLTSWPETDQQSAQTAMTLDDAVEPPPDSLDLGQITSLRGRRQRSRELVPTVVIDESALFRAGLCHILAGSRFQVAAEYRRLSDVSPDRLSRKRGVIIISLNHTDTEVTSGISVLTGRNKELCVLALGDHLGPKLLVDIFDSGARGYLLRHEIGADVVLKSLELVLVGGNVVPQGFIRLLRDTVAVTVPAPTPASAIVRVDTPAETAPSVLEDIAAKPEVAPPPQFARLSDREQLILVHLTQGASNKHIARALNLAEATVKVHMKSVLRKIRVGNRTQAAMWAISHMHTTEPTASSQWHTLATTSC